MKLNTISFVIVIAALLLFLPFYSVHLFDWDEINFAEAAREMLVTHDYFTVTIDYQPFWEKPPLFIWMQALFMSLFGVNEMAARFPNVLCGIATLLLLYRIGVQLFDKNFALFWVLAYLGSFLPQFYFMSGIIDPVFNLFIFLVLYCFFQYGNQNSTKYIAFAGLFTGLAVLTKGPVAILIIFFCLVFYHAICNATFFKHVMFLKKRFLINLSLFLLSTISVCSLFYGVELIRHGSWYFEEFYKYHLRLMETGDAGHGQPFYYHFVVLLIGCFPASVFVFGSLKNTEKDTETQKRFRYLMLVLLCVVLIVFSMVRTKIIHYSSLCYFPITYLAAHYMYHTAFKKRKVNKGIIAALAIGSLFALILAAVPFLMSHKQLIIPFIKDEFAVANLEATVNWTGYESLGGVLYLMILCFSVYLLFRSKTKLGYLVLLIGTAIASNTAIKMIVPRMETVIQGAAIEFYESLQDKDCYLEVLDFKSYAHLFYARKKPAENPNARKKDWLLSGAIDKPVYLVCKNTAAPKYRTMPGLHELYQKNGFVFFHREPSPAK